MNKFVITIISSLLLMGSGTALAQYPDEGSGKKGSRNQRGIPGNPLIDHMMRAIRQPLGQER